MANIGKRIQTTPLIIHDTREITRLKRIPLNERIFQEEWLQQLINDYPDMLPVDEIEPIFSPLVMIGKEVATKAGINGFGRTGRLALKNPSNYQKISIA